MAGNIPQHTFIMAEDTGLEPVRQLRFAGFQDRCVTNYANPPWVREMRFELMTSSLWGWRASTAPLRNMPYWAEACLSAQTSESLVLNQSRLYPRVHLYILRDSF